MAAVGDAESDLGAASADEQGPSAPDTTLAGREPLPAPGYRVENGVAVPEGRVSAQPERGVFVVRVEDGEGRPVAGRTVRLGEETPLRASEPRARKTDETGHGRWTGLVDGSKVSAVADDPGWAVVWVHGLVGGPVAVLESARTTARRVRVIDAAGAPVPEARVVLYGPPSRHEDPLLLASSGVNPAPRSRRPPLAAVRSDREGIATLSVPKDHEAGRLWVHAEGFATWVDHAWTVRDAEVRLEPARTLVGTVRDAAGAVLGDGMLWWRTEQGLHGVEGVAGDGTFRVPHLASSVVRLEWRLPQAPELDGKNVLDLAPGPAPIDFRVTLGAVLTVRIEGWPREGTWIAQLKPREESDEVEPLRGVIGVDGVVRFVGLDAARRYALWVPPRREGSIGVAFRDDLAPSEATVVVRLVPGRTIRGVLDLAGTDAAGPVGAEGPWRSAGVELRGPGLFIPADVPKPLEATDPNEIPFRFEHVPDGSFALRASLELRDKNGWRGAWIGEATTPATDEPVRIRLRPAPDEDR